MSSLPDRANDMAETGYFTSEIYQVTPVVKSISLAVHLAGNNAHVCEEGACVIVSWGEPTIARLKRSNG